MMMKKWITLMAVAMVAGGVFAAESLEYWSFDDVAGKSFNTFANSGSLNSVWNYGGTGGTMETDGAGSFVVSNHNGTTYRKLPDAGTANADATKDEYSSPMTSGVYRLEIDYTSWDLDSNAVGSSLDLHALSADNATVIAGIKLKVQDSSTARIQLFTDLAGTAQGFRNFDFNLTDASGASAAIEFDFDNNTVDYYINGGVSNSFTDFEGTQLAQVKFSANSFSTNSVVMINEMGLVTESGADFYVAARSGSSYNPYTTNNIASFAAETGDMLVVAIGSNQGSDPTESSITTSGTATHEPLSFNAETGTGPGGYLWYGAVTAAGSLDIEYIVGKEYSVAGVYLLRSVMGEVKLLDLQSIDGQGVVTEGVSDVVYNLTNTYSLGTSVTGIYIEAEASYQSDPIDNISGTLNPNTTVDYNNSNNRIHVGSGVFSGASVMESVWTNSIKAKAALIGAVFGVGSVTSTTPATYWDQWLSDYTLGAGTNLQDDADADLLDNLTEYAFGGDPSLISDQGNPPVELQVSDGGSNYLQYVYYERDDAAARGLASILEVGPDLVITNWGTSGIEFIGSGASAVPGYNAVTNRIPTETEAKQFIRLQVEFTP